MFENMIDLMFKNEYDVYLFNTAPRSSCSSREGIRHFIATCIAIFRGPTSPLGIFRSRLKVS